MLGYNAMLNDKTVLTPTIGIRHSRYKNSSYDETGTNFLNTHVSNKLSHKTEGIIGGKILTNIDRENIVITPEAHTIISRVL
ncbi:MAG: autotransporter outer membrane beta-barrel domain-containing protein [Candidatus Rickettsia vulgarisii]